MDTNMKNSGIEWIGNIPEPWEVVPVKYHFFSKKQVAGNQADNYERLALTLNGVIKRSKEDSEGLQPEKFETYQIIRENYLIFKLIDLENIRTSRVGLSKYTGLVSPAYIVLISKGDILPEYAEKYFLNMWYQHIFNDLGSAGVRSNLNRDDLLNLPIIKPPLHEQKRISNFLNNKIKIIDDEILNLMELIGQYTEYKKSIISEVVTTGLNNNIPMKYSGIDWIGEIPKEWDIIKAKFLFKQRNQKGNNIELQLLSSTQKFGVIPQTLYEELSNMTAVKVKEDTDLSSFKCIHKHDFCISLRSFEGGFEYCEYEGVVSPAYSVFYPNINIDNGYYKYLFKEYGFIENIKSYCMSLRDGQNIPFEDFGNTYIPYPPLEIQHEIANYLDEKCGFIDSLISEKEKLIKQLENYKKSLIFEYVTGKKEVPNEI